MIVKIDKGFVKDTERIKDQRLLNRIANCIKQVIIKNSPHRDYQDTMTWLGGQFDPDYFSVDQINKELLKRCKLRYPMFKC
jgi:hypothetical protein